MKKLNYFICFLLLPIIGFSQIGIGTLTPNISSSLDITSTKGGFLIPRMTLAQRNLIASPATGLLVFQTDGVSGFYYYNGSWQALIGSNWGLLGNASTNPATNFIGTTDAQPFLFKTNNTEQIRILTGGDVGIGTPTPTVKFDLAGTLRIVDGFEGAGNILVSDALGNTKWNTSNSIGLSGWNLTGNSGTNSTTHFLGTGDNQDLVIRTNNTEKIRVLANGNVGIGITAPTSRLDVSADLDNLAVIKGVNTNTTAGTISYGVQGEGKSTGLGSAGISAISTFGGEGEIGILGDYQTWGAGVFGLGYNSSGSSFGLTYMTSLRDYGVYGSVYYPGGFGIYGYDAGNFTGSTPGVNLISYALYGNGKFATTGTKSASVPTTKGNQLLYCAENPEIWFEDLGTSKLINGSVHISLDEMFLETIFVDDTHKIRVFVQQEGESNGLIVIRDNDNKGFTVKEKNGGTSNIEFSYRIMAKRRFYQNQRFGVDSAQPLENNLIYAKEAPIATTDPEKVKEAITYYKSEKEKLNSTKKEVEIKK